MLLFQLCDIKFTSFLRRSILPSPVFLFFFAHSSCSHYMTEVDVWVRESQSRKFYHACTTLQSFIFDYSRNCELIEAIGDYESDSEPPSSGDLFITDAMNSSNDGVMIVEEKKAVVSQPTQPLKSLLLHLIMMMMMMMSNQ